MTRPISPSEAARVEARLSGKPQPPPARFEIGQVLSRSFGVVRRRWMVFLLLTLGLGFGARLAVVFGLPRLDLRHHDNGLLALWLGQEVGLQLCVHLAEASVVAASLHTANVTLGSAFRTALAALPVLAPIWLLSEYDTVWGDLDRWFGWTRAMIEAQTARHSPGLLASEFFLNLLYTRLFLELTVALGSVAAFAIFSPVVLEERASIVGGLRRSWRLMAGSRWKVVGLYVLVAAVGVLPSFAVLPFPRQTVMRQIASWTAAGAEHLVDGFWAVVAASIYVEQRRLREGSFEDEIAETFA